MNPFICSTIGEYLYYLHALDKDWVEKNIDRIFPKDNETHWNAAFSGYLEPPTVFNEFYDLLRSHSHYEKALHATFYPALRKRLIDHICFGYLRGVEKFEESDSLIRKIIESWDLQTLDDIEAFFWFQRGHIPLSDLNKVVAYWEMVASHYESKSDLSAEEKVILSHLTRLSAHLPSIDARARHLLNLSIKYTDRGHDTPTVVENLGRPVQVSPKQVGEIYVEMLKNEIFPDYDRKHIISCVEKLYVASEKILANTICNMYLQRGYDFLKEVFDRYNKGSDSD